MLIYAQVLGWLSIFSLVLGTGKDPGDSVESVFKKLRAPARASTEHNFRDKLSLQEIRESLFLCFRAASPGLPRFTRYISCSCFHSTNRTGLVMQAFAHGFSGRTDGKCFGTCHVSSLFLV